MGYVFFGVYILCIAGVYISKSKKEALWLNALCCSACAVYLFLEGGHAGVVACIAAALGALFQLYMSQKQGDTASLKADLYKLAGSTLFTIIGISMIYQSPSDLVLIFAIAICRGSEMLKDARHVKLGYLFAEALWFIYAADNGLMGMYFVHAVMVTIGLTTMYFVPALRARFTARLVPTA